MTRHVSTYVHHCPYVLRLSVGHLDFAVSCSDAASSCFYTLSLHDALPICLARGSKPAGHVDATPERGRSGVARSEEHTSELQSRVDLVCRLLLEKKKEMHNRWS